jgi:hypothetical protein
MKEVAMLLPLRRPLKNSATCCAFEILLWRKREVVVLGTITFLKKEGIRISED